MDFWPRDYATAFADVERWPDPSGDPKVWAWWTVLSVEDEAWAKFWAGVVDSLPHRVRIAHPVGLPEGVPLRHFEWDPSVQPLPFPVERIEP